MAFPFPPGFSALIDPDDEPTIAILELCADDRRRLGLPSYTRADLERLFAVLDAPAPPRAWPANVVPLPPNRALRTRRDRRR